MGKGRVLSFHVEAHLASGYFPVHGQNHETRVKKKEEWELKG